jgi:hypothetical protein
LAAANGQILAAYAPEERDRNAPIQMTMVAAAGQVVREVKVPEDLKRAGLAPEILRKYRLAVQDESGELFLVETNRD